MDKNFRRVLYTALVAGGLVVVGATSAYAAEGGSTAPATQVATETTDRPTAAGGGLDVAVEVHEPETQTDLSEGPDGILGSLTKGDLGGVLEGTLGEDGLVDDLLGVPGTDEPGTDEPGTDEPGTDEPGTDEPGTDEPGTDEPGTDEPGTDEPGTDEPGTDEPGTDEPGTDEPGTDEPGTDEPGTDEPGTDEPGTDEPGTDEPGTDEPGTDEPGTDEPGTGKPGTGKPAKPVKPTKPGAHRPGTVDPEAGAGTDRPRTNRPGTASGTPGTGRDDHSVTERLGDVALTDAITEGSASGGTAGGGAGLTSPSVDVPDVEVPADDAADEAGLDRDRSEEGVDISWVEKDRVDPGDYDGSILQGDLGDSFSAQRDEPEPVDRTEAEPVRVPGGTPIQAGHMFTGQLSLISLLLGLGIAALRVRRR